MSAQPNRPNRGRRQPVAGVGRPTRNQARLERRNQAREAAAGLTEPTRVLSDLDDLGRLARQLRGLDDQDQDQ